MATDRNLLFGMLALHNGLLSRERLIDGMTAWMSRKQTPLGDILREQGALSEEDQRFLDGFVARQVKQHGDAARSLASLPIDPDVRKELGRLPDADVQASLVMRSPPETTQPEGVPVTANTGPPSHTTPRYRRLRPHAKGGLGEVSVALDEELHREVALKEIQERFADQPDSRSRFVREAEITGNLEHPGVVPLYGLGVYPDGRPYYAMRLIRGESMQETISRFHKADETRRDAGERSLGLRDLLTRFVAVCDAVAFAHSRGVVHRDLKPANVMLGEYGETLVVDWGLARLLEQADGERTTAERPMQVNADGTAPTQMGQVVGTPAYMPPEQATGRLDRVGPASDVFALGATLYGLLTGQPPYGGEDVLSQARRAEVTPARRRKATVPAALEAVCQRAMRAEAKDRYATARALADEVRHWLADEPVTAYREPVSARAGRWARKHRTLVTSIAAVGLVTLLGLAVGLAVVGGLYQKLDESNGKLTESLDETERQRNETKKERDVAVAVNDFLQQALLGQAYIGNQMLGSDKEERNPKITVAELLDRAAKNIEGKFKGREETEAAIRRTIGATYRALSKFEEALPQLLRSVALFEQTLGADHPDTLTSKNSLAVLYLEQGKYDKAEPLLLEVIEQQEKRLGADHPSTLNTKSNLALLYYDQGKNDKAEPLLLEVLEQREQKLRADDPDTLRSKYNLAVLYQGLGKHDKAKPLFLEVIQQWEKKLGADHPKTLISKGSLAQLYSNQGRHDRAEPLLLEVIRLQEKKLGTDHPHTLTSKNNLAALYWSMKKLDRSISLFEQLLALREKKLGADHPKTLLNLANLGVNYGDAGRLDDAIRCLEDALARADKRPGGFPASLAWVRGELVATYEAAKQYTKAEPFYRAALEHARKQFGPDDPRTAGGMAQLGLNLLQQKKYIDAEALLLDCLRLREKSQPDEWTTSNTKSMVGEALLFQKKHADAEPLLVQGYEGMKQRQAKIPPKIRTVRLKEALERLVALYDATGKKDEAAKYRKELDALPKPPEK